jgi:hypothetical protein
MRFLFVGSHLCTRASFRQSLTGLPLPSASGYPDDIGSSHRGLSPHKLMPMSGVHPGVQPTAKRRCRLVPGAHCAPAAGEGNRYAAFDAARAFLARWPLSARSCRLKLGVLSFLFSWMSISHAPVRPLLEGKFSQLS